MKKHAILTAILILSAASFGSTAQAQNPQTTTVDPVIGWNLTETDLKTMKLGDLFLKAGGEPALDRIQAKANAPGGQFGMFAKKSKKDNIAPLLMGIANRLGYFTGKTAEAEKYYYKVAADLGNFRAMEELARLSSDVTESAQLMRKAADAGYPGAMNGYGFALAAGQGINQDMSAAIDWFRRSSELGNSAGTFNVGNAYWNGDGLTANRSEAVLWFQRAADAGYAPAMQVLGKIYVDGDGVPQDRDRGIQLLRNAATAGNAEAKVFLAQQTPQKGVEIAQSDRSSTSTQGRVEKKSSRDLEIDALIEKANTLSREFINKSLSSINPSDRAIVTPIFEKMPGIGINCFSIPGRWFGGIPLYIEECKSFSLDRLSYRPLSKADIANGIESIVKVEYSYIILRPDLNWGDGKNYNIMKLKNGIWSIAG